MLPPIDTHWTVTWTHEGHKFPTTNAFDSEELAIAQGQFLRDLGIFGTGGIHISKVEYGQGCAISTDTWNPYVNEEVAA